MFRRRVFRNRRFRAAAYAIPILANAGVKEQKTDGERRRTLGGLADDFPGVPGQGRVDRFRALDPRTGRRVRRFAVPGNSWFFDAMMAMRLPAKGSKDQRLRPAGRVEGLARSADGR